jgi:hypothetical protein
MRNLTLTVVNSGQLEFAGDLVKNSSLTITLNSGQLEFAGDFVQDFTLTVTLTSGQLEFVGEFMRNFNLTVVNSGVLEFAGDSLCQSSTRVCWSLQVTHSDSCQLWSTGVCR